MQRGGRAGNWGLTMSYILGFAPWILYAILNSNWRLSVCVAAVAAAGLVVRQIRLHDVDLLTPVTFVFFAVMAVIALADSTSGIHHWTPALASGTLAVIAIGSLAARRPFTLSFARKEVPEEFWNSPIFLRTNDIITGAWALAFTASAVVCALIVHHNPKNSTALIIVQVLGFVLPMVFTRRYSAHVRAARPAT
jgi:hypothetical protein